jgi:beta-lactamase regulating signal transducer with metallopeptidase domain
MTFLQMIAWNALEATVLALAIAIGARLFKLGAPLRHVLWLLVLLKLVFPPLVAHPLGLSSACARVWHALDARTEVETERYTVESSDAVDEEPDGDVSLAVLSPSAPPELREWPQLAESRGFREVLPSALFLAWLAGAVAKAILEAMRLSRFRLGLRLAEAAPPGMAQECEAISRRLGLARAPPVKVTEEDISPLVWALGRPVIFIPRRIADASSLEALRSVLAHELAHIRRRDHWAAWVELLGSLLFWWLPTFWWARRELRSAADQAADSWAVCVMGSRETYAESLLDVVQLISARPPLLPLFGQSLGQREVIQRRLIMILRDKVSHKLSLSSKVCVALLGLMVLPASQGGGLAQSASSASSGVLPVEARPAVPIEPIEPPEPAAPAKPAAPAAQAEPAQLSRSSHEQRLDRLELNFKRILDELAALRASLPASNPNIPGGRAWAGPRKATIQPVAPRGDEGHNSVQVAPRLALPPARIPGQGVLRVSPPPQAGQARPLKARVHIPYELLEKGSEETLKGLSPDQRDQLKILNDQFQRQMDELQRRMEDFTRQHERAVKDLLTPQQLQELKARRTSQNSKAATTQYLEEENEELNEELDIELAK